MRKNSFLPGDILLKVDTRGIMLDTRHHTMLVVGQENGYPVVMHMVFSDHPGQKVGELRREILMRGKDLDLLSFAFSDQCRAAIVSVASECHASKKFQIDAEVLRAQTQQISSFRTDNAAEFRHNMEKLGASFIADKDKLHFTPRPDAEIKVSCHEFVLEVIQFACFLTNTLIPQTLRIPATAGWSDVLVNRYYLYNADTARIERGLSLCHRPVSALCNLSMVTNQNQTAKPAQSGSVYAP